MIPWSEGEAALFTWIIVCVVSLCSFSVGYPVVREFGISGRTLTRALLAVFIGFCILVLSGTCAELLRIDPFPVQIGIIIIGFLLTGYRIRDDSFSFSRNEIVLLSVASFYCLVLCSFFSYISFWMGGDLVAHASIIRLLIDHVSIPQSFPPFGSYWEYYPKGFHIFIYPFAAIFGIIPTIQAIPVLLTAFLPLTVSAILLERRLNGAAWYGLLLGLFCIPQTWASLIWAGYPSLFAGVLLGGTVLAFLVDKRIIPIFGAGILIIHSREFALFLVIIAGLYGIQWVSQRKCGLPRNIVIAITGLTGITLCFLSIPTMMQVFSSGLTDLSGITLQAVRWYWIIPALCGFGICVIKTDSSVKELAGWLIGLVFFLLVVLATGQTNFFPPERILTDCAVPLIGMGGLALAAMANGVGSSRFGYYLSGVLLVTGLIVMSAIFGFYTITWAVPSDDRDALTWLSGQNFTHPIVVNLDETGGWAYPITGIPVSHPRVVPGIEITQPVYSSPWKTDVLQNPDDVRRRVSGYDSILIYISSISITKPGYSSPFSEYPYPYPNGTISLPSEYVRIYDKGAQIYELRAR